MRARSLAARKLNGGGRGAVGPWCVGNEDLSTAAESYGELWADIYDDAHPFMTPSEAQLSLLAELTGDGRAVELGIGTGRVASPLAARGRTGGGPRRLGVDGGATALQAWWHRPLGDDVRYG